MTLYECMREYAAGSAAAHAEDLPHPELGKSLALLHACLLEAGLERAETAGAPVLTAPPESLEPNHLSRFVVAYLPFNSVSTQEEINGVLFEVYSFVRWMDQQGRAHGWRLLDYPAAVRHLTAEQERCLQLSHFLDHETGRVLEETPPIWHTLTDIFQVTQLTDAFVLLQGIQNPEPVRLSLPRDILDLVRPKDHLDLVLGDTSERWVLLEAGQVFPEIQASEPSHTN